jgi:hypothetical protein
MEPVPDPTVDEMLVTRQIDALLTRGRAVEQRAILLDRDVERLTRLLKKIARVFEQQFGTDEDNEDDELG